MANYVGLFWETARIGGNTVGLVVWARLLLQVWLARNKEENKAYG